MFRAMSTKKIHGGYEKLMEEEPILKKGTSVPASVYGNSRNPVQDAKTPTSKPTGGSVHPLLNLFNVRFQRKKKKKKKKSFGTAKPTGGSVHPLLNLFNVRFQRKKKKKSFGTAKPTGGSVHPLLSLFRFERKKKKTKSKKSLATAKPEFARYMEYVKEGGVWDPNSNAPLIHYR
ncbi:hypothetical protein Bca52824_070539 [Brassica carinata]|uniref:Uncharacterized protein n=1 Tax=Brassica carinata TaxID=52824 RepID=A0A8X7U277_BRACI|nr:hypothetical protein Bca52824_070539 [Brassica carinata]